MSGPPKTPLLTVDCVVFDESGALVLIERGHEPFKGCFALPGGVVDVGETVEQAALRELKEETGASGRVVRLIGVYSEPSRDPRGHTVSAAFVVEWDGTAVSGGDDAASAAFVRDWREKRLAFDHAKIVADAERGSSDPRY